MDRHVDKMLSAYIDDELTLEEQMIVEEHLENCSRCQLLAEELSGIKGRIFDVYDVVEMPALLEKKVMDKIAEGQRITVNDWKLISYLGISSVLVTLFLLFSLSTFAGFTLPLFSSIINITSGVLRVIPVLLSQISYLFTGLLTLNLIIILASIWFLRYLLIIRR